MECGVLELVRWAKQLDMVDGFGEAKVDESLFLGGQR